jgi:hypothetical protein
MILGQLLKSAINIVRNLLWIAIILLCLSASSVPFRDPVDNVRRFTRQLEFEFVGWTLDALWSKIEQFSISATARMSEESRKEFVVEYFDLLRESQQLQRQVESIVGDPDEAAQKGVLSDLQEQLNLTQRTLMERQPLVESILQQQATFILAELGFGLGGRIFPPLAFEFTPLPLTLIVSPREVIQQDANIPLDANMELSDKISLEEQVDRNLNVSSLVVNIGGIGTYPTMVLESSSIAWVIDTVIHEWAHNYLTLRPLGLNYLKNSDLRTMNETTASIIGREVARQVLLRYYPGFVPEPVEPSSEQPLEDPDAFNFRAEMHETRITADRLLAEGQIEQAEQYMQAQRQYIWDNGYRIRKLNQAYFAFHGAYADVPGGAAGDDPVGDAVRALWDRIESPAEFLWTMSWMSNFSDLQEEIHDGVTRP